MGEQAPWCARNGVNSRFDAPDGSAAVRSDFYQISKKRALSFGDQCACRCPRCRMDANASESVQAVDWRAMHQRESKSPIHWYAPNGVLDSRGGSQRPCQLAVFSSKLPSMEQEICRKLFLA